VARMAITPGIPIPSAMPRVSLERPFNGADDGVDENINVGDCMVDVGSGLSEWVWGTETMDVCDFICEDNVVVAIDITDEDVKLPNSVSFSRRLDSMLDASASATVIINDAAELPNSASISDPIDASAAVNISFAFRA
jgi:hypothetical protein